MPSLRAIIAYISQTPPRLFWAFALTHLVLWTAIPSLVSPNMPLDVIEGYAWGKEWLIGTHKHPPMQAWILETLFQATGRSRWVPYLASQLCIITAFWAVWQTGRRIAGEKAGLIGAMLLEGIIYYNFTSPEFNPNVLQIPFWALAGWSFYRGIKDDKITDWLLLGLWAAAGMYSKYSSGLFLLLLIGAALAHRDGRRRLSSIGPYLSLGVALLLFLPHLLWLVHNNFLPFEYAQERLERNPDYYPALISTVLMVAGQVIALLFALLLLIVLYDQRRAPSSAPAASFDRIFLSFAAFGPFILAFFMSLIFGYHIRDMWETPFWNFIGLWAIVFLRPALMPQDVRRFAMTLGVALCAALLVFIGSVSLGPYVSHKNNRMIFPGSKLSQNIIDTWHGRFRTPLHYVIGDVWPAGNVAWYADDRPHVFVDGEPKINPWIDPAQLKKEGGVVVWCIHCGERLMSEDMPSALKKKFPEAQIQPPLTLKRITYANVSPAVIGWALIPPEGRE